MFSDEWSKRAAAVIGWTVLYSELKRTRLDFLARYAEGCLSDEVSEAAL